MPLQTELLKATGVKEMKDWQKTLEKIVEAVDELEDDKWRALSPAAQNWFNVASKAYNNKQPIPDFKTKPEEVVVKKVKKVKKVVAKPVNNEAPRKTKGKPPATAATLIKQIILKNPGITSTDVCEQLKKRNITVSKFSVNSIGSSFRHSIRLLQSMGLVKPSVKI